MKSLFLRMFHSTFALEKQKMTVSNNNMFDTLLGLPLFQGLSRDDMTRIVESLRLDFDTYEIGTPLCRQDDVCTHVLFVIDGCLRKRTLSVDRKWAVEEDLGAGTVVGLEVLYGRRRTYESTCTTLQPTRMLMIDKRTMGALFRYFEVMQLNAFNHLTSVIAQHEQLAWLPTPQTLEGRIARFFQSHVSKPAGHKRFDISLATFGRQLAEDPRYVSRALRSIEAKGLITVGRRSVDIPTFERLLQNI